MTLTFETEDEVTNHAIGWLRERGFAVTRPRAQEWRTPKEIAGECGLKAEALCHRLAHPNCPDFEAKKGPTGRRIYILPSPALMDFLRQPQRQGKRLNAEVAEVAETQRFKP